VTITGDLASLTRRIERRRPGSRCGNRNASEPPPTRGRTSPTGSCNDDERHHLLASAFTGSPSGARTSGSAAGGVANSIGRSTRDVLNLVHELDQKGAGLRVLEPEFCASPHRDRQGARHRVRERLSGAVVATLGSLDRVAKRYTEFCVSGAGYRRFVGDRRQVAGHRRVVVDCRQVAGQTHLAESSLAVDHNQIAGRKQVVMGLHQQLPRNQENLPW
jgi:hypothetical protein